MIHSSCCFTCSTRILTADTALYKNYHLKICEIFFCCNQLDNFVIYDNLIFASRDILQQTDFTIVSRIIKLSCMSFRVTYNQIELYVISCHV